MHTVDNTHDKLVEAGIKLFGQNDFSKVSTRDLTKQAGACLGALFYHFGSKKNLYIAVVKTLANEVSSKISVIDFECFKYLDVPAMQLELTRTIYLFNDLFTSKEIISFTNIVNREALNKNNAESSEIIRSFAKKARESLNQILISYYTKISLPVENVEFIITLMFSILKNHLIRDGGFYNFKNYETEILDKLIILVLHQKLVEE